LDLRLRGLPDINHRLALEDGMHAVVERDCG